MLMIALVLAEGDFGNAIILTVILGGMLFVVGAPLRLFSVAGSLCLVGVAFLAWTAPYRIERFTSFLNPAADRLDGAWQVTQGMVAFGTGGLFGAGLGASREKWGTLPDAHTDFIFAVIGEELGLVGTAERARPVRAADLRHLPADPAHRRPVRHLLRDRPGRLADDPGDHQPRRHAQAAADHRGDAAVPLVRRLVAPPDPDGIGMVLVLARHVVHAPRWSDGRKQRDHGIESPSAVLGSL